MNIVEYLGAVKERLTTDPVVSDFTVVRERITLADGHMRARLSLRDGSTLEFSEYVRRLPRGEIEVVTYSYHWADADGRLLRRWDNTPHFPGLPCFPHHVHHGSQDAVVPGAPVSIARILDEIARLVSPRP
jgi:hypothetical protein